MDVTQDSYLEAVAILKNELRTYSSSLLKERYMIVGTKMDIHGAEERYLRLKNLYTKDTVIGISSFTEKGIPELKKTLQKIADWGG